MDIAVIFDLDGTLIDVRDSYKEAIVQTVQIFRPDTRREDVIKVMDGLIDIPNLNNDWDATYYVLKKLSGERPYVQRDSLWKNVQRTFQALYLGEDLFFESYGAKPPVDAKRGLIENETSLIRKPTLERMADIPKGIVTSRPRIEAHHTIQNSLLKDFFDLSRVITLDDVEREKPDPQPLMVMKERISAGKYYYVGDTIDDAAASKEAGYTSIIIKGKWGDISIPDINALPEALSLCDRK